jgi:hypothetical protein
MNYRETGRLVANRSMKAGQCVDCYTKATIPWVKDT